MVQHTQLARHAVMSPQRRARYQQAETPSLSGTTTVVSSHPHELTISEFAHQPRARQRQARCQRAYRHSTSCSSTISHLGKLNLTPLPRMNSRWASLSLWYNGSPSSSKGQIPMTYGILTQPKGIPYGPWKVKGLTITNTSTVYRLGF